MSADPRFDIEPSEYTETQKRRSKWTSCLIGCLVVLGVLLVLAIIVGVWVARNARGWAADFSSQIAHQAINASNLPQQEKGEVIEQVDRVTTAFRNGKISVQQFGNIMQNVMQSPLMPAIIVMGVDAQYINQSGLSDDEKTQGRIALKRFAQGAVSKKIGEQGINAVMAHVADRDPNGQWRPRQQVSDADLKAALAEAKSQADTAGIEETPPEIDFSTEFKQIIDKELPGN